MQWINGDALSRGPITTVTYIHLLTCPNKVCSSVLQRVSVVPFLLPCNCCLLLEVDLLVGELVLTGHHQPNVLHLIFRTVPFNNIDQITFI